MKDKQLLSLMFSDATEFREQLLGETLRRVRRRRRIRHGGQVLAMLTIFASVLWWSLPRRSILDAPLTASAGPQVIHTQRLAAERIVTSRADSVAMIVTDKSSVVFVGDEELLELVPGETKLLVWHAPNQAELVIVGF